MRAESSAGTWRIWLDCITFVKIALVIKLFEQPPYRLNISVVVGDIWIVQINPISHLMGKISPLSRIFHNLPATGGIIFIYRYFSADIFLCDSKCFFNTKFHRKSMSIPSGFTLHMEAFHCLIAANYVFNSTRHDVMDAGHTIGGRGTLKKHECRTTLALFHTRFEERIGIPELQHLFVDVGKIELFAVFLKILCHL